MNAVLEKNSYNGAIGVSRSQPSWVLIEWLLVLCVSGWGGRGGGGGHWDPIPPQPLTQAVSH